MNQSQENGWKPHFWLFGSFKKAFLWFLNDPAWLIRWSNRAYHLVLSKYAISNQSDVPNSRKWPKTSFFVLFCTIYAHYACIINYAWPITMVTCWETFSTTIICDIESIRATKVEKKVKNLIFCSFLHNLCILCILN